MWWLTSVIPTLREAETEGLQVLAQSGQLSKIPSQNKKEKEKGWGCSSTYKGSNILKIRLKHVFKDTSTLYEYAAQLLIIPTIIVSFQFRSKATNPYNLLRKLLGTQLQVFLYFKVQKVDSYSMIAHLWGDPEDGKEKHGDRTWCNVFTSLALWTKRKKYNSIDSQAIPVWLDELEFRKLMIRKLMTRRSRKEDMWIG